ncbi:MAG: DNA mismatch repair endonuclease MutL [Gemmatimonadaceae bacterium]
MPTIAILPGAVADQIAAGEVVERPASVVKELVENALDAGATTVDVTVQDGGRALICVADDGSGMDRDDVLLALERHGTSKIRTAADLVGVATFGFRGEALPAISSVSELLLESCTAGGKGLEVRTAAGEVLGVADVARRPGTTVTVSRLFYNVPARQKFLRGARSEWRAIAETMSNMALARRDVRFTLTHDGKQAMSVPPATDLRERLAALYGADYAASLVQVEDLAGAMHTSGLVEKPADVGTRTRRIFITINGRVIRDHGLVRAAEAAYRNTIPPGVRPSLFLDVVLPADLVDVNVHPAKAEVRFRDRWPVERAVEAAVRRALGNWDSSASLGPRAYNPGWNSFQAAARADAALNDAGGLSLEFTASPAHAGNGTPAFEVAGESAADEAVAADDYVPPLFQLHRTYVTFEHDGSGLVLIDQHAAHERILYERFLSALESGGSPSQRLLFPITLHVGGPEIEAFEENREYLEKIGFEVELFGGNTLLVHSVPAPHPRFDAERCLRETLTALTGDRAPGNIARHERLLATVACKAAVKGGDVLAPDEMRALFLALRDTKLPAHDVHGRATIVRIAWDELERRFGRR